MKRPPFKRWCLVREQWVWCWVPHVTMNHQSWALQFFRRFVPREEWGQLYWMSLGVRLKRVADIQELLQLRKGHK